MNKSKRLVPASARGKLPIVSNYYTPEEAAERLRVSSRTMYTLLRSGEIPAKKVGRAWRITHQVVDG